MIQLVTLRRHVAALLVPAALLTACGSPTGPGADEITELPRALTSSEKAVIQHGNSFGLELVTRTVARDSRTNVVLSPLSASMALGMTLNGAGAQTFEAMRDALGFRGMTQPEINEAYRGLIDLLTDLDPEVRFDIANSVWTNQQVTFHQSFIEAVRASFDARAESRNFADGATLGAINDWVSQSTNGFIKKILDSLDPQMAALLINAIYFDGAWTSQFDPKKTQKQAFTRADGSKIQVDMMSLSDVDFPLGGGADYQAVELPYGGKAFSMVVVVPQGDVDVRTFVGTLNESRWQGILDGLRTTKVDRVSIPKFTLEYDGYLNDPLKDMGMGVAFRPGADFTRMSPQGGSFCIDFVRQKTFIQVDERGTKAAAVTAVGVGPTSFIGLVADRPFVFAIRERLSGTLLFVGMVGDPTASDPGPKPVTSECR